MKILGVTGSWKFFPSKFKVMVWFYGISNIAGYLIPNPFYTYINYMISKHILKLTFLNKSKLVFLHIVKWFYLILNNSV